MQTVRLVCVNDATRAPAGLSEPERAAFFTSQLLAPLAAAPPGAWRRARGVALYVGADAAEAAALLAAVTRLAPALETLEVSSGWCLGSAYG